MTEQKTSPNILIVDGYNFVFRAFHALPSLSRPDGAPVGAVFGFISMLIKLISTHEDSPIAIVFDSGGENFRKNIYPAYKANRPPVHEDLRLQFQLIRDAVDALGLNVLEKNGFEADDIIATLTHTAQAQNLPVTIVSSDKDLMQLVGEGVVMYDPIKAKTINSADVKEKYGVMPDKLLDLFALIGDSSDNIPGAPGIGPKTALDLINNFGSLDNIFANSSSINPERRRLIIENNIEQIKISRDLITLVNEVPIIHNLQELPTFNPDLNRLIAFLEQQGFKNLISRLRNMLSPREKFLPRSFQIPVEKKSICEVVKNKQDLARWVTFVRNEAKIAIHIIREGKLHNVTKIMLSTEAGKNYLVHIEQDNSEAQQSFDFTPNTESTNQLTYKQILKTLEPLLTDNSILKIIFDFKKFQNEIAELIPELEVKAVDDIMLMSYIISNGLHEHNLESISQNYLQESWQEDSCDKLISIHALLINQLFTSHHLALYERMDKLLISVLTKMEQIGVRVDAVRLKELSNEFSARLDVLAQAIWKEAGYEFNIGSPKQLADVLFGSMGLTLDKPFKSGKVSTSSEVLEELEEKGHPIAKSLLEWRQLSKLKSTYTDALPGQINKRTGRVHTTFGVASTTTGRLSSSDPNLQNIPIKSEEGKKIRSAFVAEQGYKLLSADYSQIELRLLAHMANIPMLKQAFAEKKDIHAITASQIFGIPIEEVDAATRRKAKAINFGIIYGISAFGLAKQLSISRSNASQYIQAYFREYPGIEHYMEQTKEFARNKGYVETLLGRRCYIKTIKDSNAAIRNFAERAAINAPLQGTAADVIKTAMVKLDEIFKRQRLRTRMILQVHDELLFEIPINEIEIVPVIIKNTMENVISLEVPLTVDIGVGENWALIH
jgi:DNA polymerase-1